ncbi:MFS transporter [Nocardia testacea]|uniref:MFS transporter n=1 Tax=Nocardia testacea TaxID=248551 RepID=UPI003A84053C
MAARSLAAGNWIAGRLSDRHPTSTVLLLLVLLITALTAQGLFASAPVLTVALLFVVGVAGFGLIPPLQNRVLAIAGRDASLASVANIAAFNTGATIGSLLGAAALETSGSYTAPSYAGALMSLTGLGIFALGLRATTGTRHTPRRVGQASRRAPEQGARDTAVSRATPS